VRKRFNLAQAALLPPAAQHDGLHPTIRPADNDDAGEVAEEIGVEAEFRPDDHAPGPAYREREDGAYGAGSARRRGGIKADGRRRGRRHRRGLRRLRGRYGGRGAVLLPRLHALTQFRVGHANISCKASPPASTCGVAKPMSRPIAAATLLCCRRASTTIGPPRGRTTPGPAAT